MIPVLPRKPRPLKDQQRSMTAGLFLPRIERIFTNGERLRRRISFSVLFVFQMSRAWIAEQDGRARFPSGSGCLNLSILFWFEDYRDTGIFSIPAVMFIDSPRSISGPTAFVFHRHVTILSKNPPPPHFLKNRPPVGRSSFLLQRPSFAIKTRLAPF